MVCNVLGTKARALRNPPVACALANHQLDFVTQQSCNVVNAPAMVVWNMVTVVLGQHSEVKQICDSVEEELLAEEVGSQNKL